MAVIVSGVFVSGYRILIMLGRLFVGRKGSVALSLFSVMPVGYCFRFSEVVR